jgi:hypothetical protein
VIWSVFGGTGGVRTVLRSNVSVTDRWARSIQYCHPSATSWRNIVITVSGVVVVYHTDRSYWWPGITLGAQLALSSIIALRSPSVLDASVTDIATSPLCA